MSHPTEHPTRRAKPIVLAILDGWGHSDAREHNAIAAANTPVWDRLCANYPYGTLNASEGFVGLPAGQMGNSEVGHMHIGAGRTVMQELPRIDAAIADGSLEHNVALRQFIAALHESNGVCHLLGLISDGGVHAHLHHIIALSKLIAQAGVTVVIHAITDGRDTPPRSATSYMASLEAEIAPYSNIHIATVSGRYYAMDRDKRWERVERAYNAMVLADALRAPYALDAITDAYKNELSDEFILPTIIGDYAGMHAHDGLLMTNFRADRARQLLTALLDPSFTGFSRSETVAFAATLGMVEYSDALRQFMPNLFAPQSLGDMLGDVISLAGLTQLRIAETEKYAHVTFFFNGGREAPLTGESRILIPSPKVATYDLKPEMAAPEVTDALVEAIDSGQYDVVIVNYANTDMVGHSGLLPATIKAVEAVDICLGRLVESVTTAGGVLVITADHGNAESMHDDETGDAHTAHTLNLVPLLLVGEPFKDKKTHTHSGTLADIAPTLLALLELPKPAAMTGKNLLADIYAPA
jgi:2,3-bisphosphoglycerate-independent phosphoglycerate mutase